jgi:plasmid stabilization system protein ParE
MKRVVFLPAAQREYDAASDYFDGQRPGLGALFIASIQAAIKRIQRNPQGFGRYKSSRYRFCVVRRFRYVVYFRELRDRIRIVAIAHGSRRPGYWRRRDAT